MILHIRHDIKSLYTREIVDKEGIAYNKDKYKELHIYDDYKIYNPVIENYIEEKYINKKLTKEDKQYLVSTYGSIPYNKSKATWQTFKNNLNKYNSALKVVTGRKGTYIIKKEDNLKDILKRGNKMNNDSELIKYLESIINTKLDKEQQKILINNIGLKDTRGRQIKSINTLNAYLIDNYNMTIISKRIKKEGKLKTVWIVSQLN